MYHAPSWICISAGRKPITTSPIPASGVKVSMMMPLVVAVRIPALGQHGDRDDATDIRAQPPWPANRVNRFAEQVFVGEFACSTLAETGGDVPFERLYLRGGDPRQPLKP